MSSRWSGLVLEKNNCSSPRIIPSDIFPFWVSLCSMHVWSLWLIFGLFHKQSNEIFLLFEMIIKLFMYLIALYYESCKCCVKLTIRVQFTFKWSFPNFHYQYVANVVTTKIKLLVTNTQFSKLQNTTMNPTFTNLAFTSWHFQTGAKFDVQK